MRKTDHPNPLLERDHWRDLNGLWRFAYDDLSQWTHPSHVPFDREIRVPYPPESRRSGIADTGAHAVIWYSKTLDLEPSERPAIGQRLLLHFGAVDYRASVWVNTQLVVTHEGGYTPFYADITEMATHEHLEIVVRAEDNPRDMSQPRGKQDWLDEPHGIWHWRTTGIWQTVWLEIVPETRIATLRWTPDLEHHAIRLETQLAGSNWTGLSLNVTLRANGKFLVSDRYAVNGPRLSRQIALDDPGIEDARSELWWSPEHPQLIEAKLELRDSEEAVVDCISSYTALRSVGSADGHFLLNTQPYYLRLVLDQGYWAEGLYAASDNELELDVVLTKQLGFNGARKHQKIESPRWLYHCDRLGLLVWDEMPSHYAFTPEAIQALSREWLEVLERDVSHPCVVVWLGFNESWGVPDLPSSVAQRDYVAGIYHLTRAFDPTRLVSGNDGWEQHATDLFGIHDYSIDLQALHQRYADRDAIEQTLVTLRPVGRALALEGFKPSTRPILLSEFGGFVDQDSVIVGLDRRARDKDHLLEMYTSLLETVHTCQGLAGFCYTQLSDVFYERNGLLDMERRPKANLEGLARATRGASTIGNELDEMGYSKRWRSKLEVIND